MSENFFATSKNGGLHGLRGWWWFLSNGLDPLVVPADQEIQVDAVAMTASYDVFDRNLLGQMMASQTGFVRRRVTEPIRLLPSTFGLPSVLERVPVSA